MSSRDSPYLREVDATWQKASRMEVEQQFQKFGKVKLEIYIGTSGARFSRFSSRISRP